MNLRLLRVYALLCVSLFVFGCNDGDGNGKDVIGEASIENSPISASKLDLTTNQSTLSTNGSESATITVFTRDDNNAPIGGVVVNLASTAGYLSVPQVTTDDTGTATFTFSPGPDLTSQVATITAKSNSLSNTLEITFVQIYGPPANLTLTSNLAPGSLLSQGGEMLIRAEVSDEDGFNVKDGSVVTFQISPPAAGSIPEEAKTVDGVATATFRAGTFGGQVTVRGTSEGVYDDLSFAIVTDDASSIKFVGADPKVVGVRSSGLSELTTLTFQVLTIGGSPVADGTEVDFKIATPLGGGEKLSRIHAPTTDGNVTVNLQSGTVAGEVAVTASITPISGSTISTIGKVLIVAGLPDTNHFGLSTTKLNLTGYSCFGESTTITAYVADRYANPVPINTPVYFTSEGGVMVMDNSNIGPAYTTGEGRATALHFTQLPLPDTISNVTNLPGLSTILAWTNGQEAFVDLNGNGLYDSGEPFDDFGEPFLDANDNQIHDAFERYVDSNNNGMYDVPNGVWDGDTFVWNTIDILWSYASPSEVTLQVIPGANCPGFVIPDNESCIITVEVKDRNNNPIIGGSTINIESNIPDTLPPLPVPNIIITPETDEPEFTVPDANSIGLGTTQFYYSLSNVSGRDPALNGDVSVTLKVPGICSSTSFEKSQVINVTLE